ncbi:MAG: DUF983 domain-containing protein [Rhodobacteraceae bacterium]|nr:DUF983 domain-containing protein [Paracoccaceae bacterium]
MKDNTIAPLLEADERPVKPALIRGWKMLCPQCGTGPMMDGFLKVRDTCEVCGEELHHQRADDGPAYVTILISGHILAPLMLIVFETYRPDPLLLVVGFSIAFVAMALYMLPRIKGAFVGLQWAKRMHGFVKTKSDANAAAE